GGMERYAVESLYSIAGVIEPGATVMHSTYLKQLAHLWNEYDQTDEVEGMVQEYLRRDLLNVVLGNSDNHGRNTSVLRQNSGVYLAPVYDLAPMVLDEAGITRTSRWHVDNEVGGNFRWREICDEAAAATNLNAARLWAGLRDFALTLFDLPVYASESGVPAEVMNIERHALNLNAVPDRLKRWGLL
ncbi:MAG: HipA domain-containing protein, partial [Pseudomonadota bacterium]|nr:HipA domain-containing protein [Pseudomonadota bacterium]